MPRVMNGSSATAHGLRHLTRALLGPISSSSAIWEPPAWRSVRLYADREADATRAAYRREGVGTGTRRAKAAKQTAQTAISASDPQLQRGGDPARPGARQLRAAPGRRRAAHAYVRAVGSPGRSGHAGATRAAPHASMRQRR